MEEETKVKHLQGKVALVTGASSGIGRATALELARHGAKVVALARSGLQLEELIRAIKAAGGTAMYVLADIARRDQVDRAVADALSQYGQLDIVVNNAGIEYLDPVCQMKEDEFRQMMEVNCFGALNVIQSVLPHLIRRQGGLIAMVSSPMMHLNFPHMGGYAASKAASTVLAETLRLEVAGQGIRVMTCHPGHTETAIASHMSPDRFPAWYGKRTSSLTPEEVAGRLALGIIRNEEHIVIGRPVQFLMTLKRYVPALAQRIIRKITATA